jgi:penicillin amidase
MQADIFSTAFAGLKPRMLALLDQSALSAEEQGLAAQLADWDGMMAREKAEPLDLHGLAACER